MIAAHMVVFVVPVCRWHTYARTKLWIDRLTALLSPEDTLPALAGRRLILVTSHTHRSCAECTIKMSEDLKLWIGVELNASERCAKDGHVSSVPYKSEAACELGKSISFGMNRSPENGQAGAHRTGIGGGFFRAILCSG